MLLQRRLQPILEEVICHDQSAFLPMRYILDNIVLTQETLNWAKVSKQPVLLKLDFVKAFDRVAWSFLFHAMEALGFDAEFINMTKLLFTGATASVCVNGTTSKPFQLSRGVRQGCLMAPYLFLIVGEILNIQLQEAAQEGQIKGIKLPTVPIFQLICQYADDTTLFLKDEERCVNNSIAILEHFCSASGLLINWLKSAAS
jgi:hypothetical protein